MDIRDLGLTADDAKKVASYIAKYSTKTTDGTRELARRFHSRRQIEEFGRQSSFPTTGALRVGPRRPARLEPLRLRNHAHAFGYTGQLITKSRGTPRPSPPFEGLGPTS